MGQAKRRDGRFGGRKVHAVASYAEAETVVAFRVDRKARDGGAMFAALEILYDAGCPSVFRRGHDLSNPPSVTPTFPEEARGLPDGVAVVLDPAAGTIRETMEWDAFRARYSPLAGSNSWHYRERGERLEVGVVDGGDFVLAGGRDIPDPLAFMAGKVRIVDGVTKKADAALCVQYVHALRHFADRGSLSDGHAGHFASLVHAAARATGPDRGAAADAVLAKRFLHDEENIDDSGLPIEAAMLDVYARVVDLAWKLPQADGFYAYAKSAKADVSIFRARVDDDAKVWRDYDGIAFGLTFDAAPVRLGEGAYRTSLEIGRAGAGPFIASSDRFFAEGRRLAFRTYGESHAELVERDGVRFLVMTTPGDIREIVAWPTTPPTPRPPPPAGTTVVGF